MKKVISLALAFVFVFVFTSPPSADAKGANASKRSSTPRKAARASALAKARLELRRDLLTEARIPSSSSGVARGDFNGDGFADLAIGIPGRSSGGATSCGAVLVIYGSANGLTGAITATRLGVPTPQLLSQGTTGISGVNESSDRFGFSLAAGEFNGDGFSDLAIGVPGEDIRANGRNIRNAGRVVVVYGSGAGLATTGQSMVRAPQSFDLTSGLLPRVETPGIDTEIQPDEARLGHSLAWGDFNGDGIGDLAIGAPNMTVKNNDSFFADAEAGQVWVLYGSLNNGLVRQGSQLLTQFRGSLGPFGGRGGWHNGASLVAGDFNGDGVSDLVVGAPDASISGKQRMGMFTVFPGGAGIGLDWGRGRFFNPRSVGLEPQSGDRFGFAFATADFDRDGLDDLAIGSPHLPGRRLVADDGSITDREPGAGAVHILFGHRDRLFSNSVQTLSQHEIFGDAREAGDHFGHSLAAGDFNGDTHPDLAIGVPREDFSRTTDAGEVNVVYGSNRGLDPLFGRAPQRLRDPQFQAGGQFGRTLSAWNFGRNETVVLPLTGLRLTLRSADLAVGSPFKDVGGRIDAGAVRVFYGRGAGFDENAGQEWTLATPGIPGSPAARDAFGAAGY